MRKQHLGPILRLGAAGAGMDRDDGVLVVVRPGKLELQLQFVELGRDAGQEALEIGVGLDGLEVGGGELLPGGELVGVGAQTADGGQAAFELAALAQQRRIAGRGVPEAGRLHLGVDLGETACEASLVKDTPGGWRAGRSGGRCAAGRGLEAWFSSSIGKYKPWRARPRR
jgi:hypothetical protein